MRPNPTVFGQTVIFTATVTVSAPGAGTPAGVMTLTDGTTLLGTGAVGAGGVVTFATRSLAVGSHILTATYGGDASFQGSSSAPVTQTVNQAATATALESVPQSLWLGQTVTFTATVTVSAPGTGTPAWRDDLHGRHDAAGYGASERKRRGHLCPRAAWGVGNHILTATYNGDASFQGSSSAPVTQTVNQAATVTTAERCARSHGLSARP